MDREAVFEQMRIFATSLIQVLEVLRALLVCSDVSQLETKRKLIDSRWDILNTLVMLNTHLQDLSLTGDNVHVGSMVLAPRLFQGILCYDLALVVNIVDSNAETTTSLCEQQASDSFKSNPSQSSKEYRTIYIIWLRPQSEYEFYSSGIAFSSTQINLNGVTFLQEQESMLNLLKQSDKIMYHYGGTSSKFQRLGAEEEDSLSAASAAVLGGVWCVGTVVDVIVGANNVAVVIQQEHNSSRYLVRKLQLTEVAPVPRSGNNNDNNSNNNFDKEATDEEEEEGSEVHVGISSLPSYQKLHSNYNNSSSSYHVSSSSSSSLLLGTWETYTKGNYYYNSSSNSNSVE